MSDNISVDDFNRKWTFFIRKIKTTDGRDLPSRFDCSSLCNPGCTDWLDADRPKRNNFKPDLIEELGQGGFAKVFKATFHGNLVAMKYIPLDKVKNGYEFNTESYGCHEYHHQERSFINIFENRKSEKLLYRYKLVRN